jgi:hypothetical protein
MTLKRWLYRNGRPNLLAKILNRGWAIIHSLGIFPNWLVTLEVVGRKSGKMTSFPLAMTVMNGERYLVSMLGGGNELGAKYSSSGRKSTAATRN